MSAAKCILPVLMTMAEEDDDSNLEFIALDLYMTKSVSDNRYPNRFNLELYSEDECLHLFRFKRMDIYRLVSVLRIDDCIRCYNKTRATRVEGLCILLRRLVYPNRLGDICPMFFRSKEEISIISNKMLNLIYDKFGHLLKQLDRTWLDHQHLQQYADAVYIKGAPLGNIFGFIDGTLRPICRPKENQRQMYSGHKREHGIKFQAIVTPNGLIANLFGPFEGRHHDAAMLTESGIMATLLSLPGLASNGYKFAVYGDPAYPVRPQLLGPIRGAVLTLDEMQFNKEMSSVRECVEWGFGKISRYFAFLDFKKNLKLMLQPVAKYYLIGALLTNCYTCLYGSQTSDYFLVEPPTLEEYINS